MNHSIWRKTLSLLLALVMVMGMVCTTALAEDGEPEVCETCKQDPCVCPKDGEDGNNGDAGQDDEPTLSELVAALPEQVTADNAESVKAQLETILAALAADESDTDPLDGETMARLEQMQVAVNAALNPEEEPDEPVNPKLDDAASVPNNAPAATVAEGDPAPQAEVKGEMTGAEFLATAVEGVITLTDDVTLTDTSLVSVPNTVVVELASNTLAFSAIGGFKVENGGNLTIQNGQVTATFGSQRNKEVISVLAGSSFTLNNVEFVTDACAILPKGNDANVSVNNSQITGLYAVSTNAGSADFYGVDISLSDSTLTGLAPVMMNVPGSLTMTNCNVTGYSHGVIARGGDVTISGGSVTLDFDLAKMTEHLGVWYGNSSDTVKTQVLDKFNAEGASWGSGTSLPSAAILAGNKGTSYQYPTNLTVTGTTVSVTETTEGYNIPAVLANSNTDANKGVTLDISSANITGEVKYGNIVAEVNGKGYASLQAAITAAVDGDTVKLLKETSVTGKGVQINNKTITLDLNGKKVTGTGIKSTYGAINVNAGSEVTLIGNGGSVEADGVVVYLYSKTAETKGKLIVNGGTYKGSTAGCLYAEMGDITVYDGTFSCDEYEGKHYVLNKLDKNKEQCNFIVYGGTFVGCNPAANNNENPAENQVAPGYKSVETAEGSNTWKVEIDIATAVAQIEGGQAYTTLQAAIDAATSGQTVTLVKNVEHQITSETKSFYVIKGKAITLDLNGYTMTMSDGVYPAAVMGMLEVDDGGKLTLVDTGETKGKIVDNNTNYNRVSAILVRNGEAIISEGVTVNGRVYTRQGGTLTVNGTVDVRGQKKPLNTPLSDGTKEVAPSAIMGNGSTGQGGTTVTVGATGSILADNVAIYHPQNGTLNIAGNVEGFAAIGIKSGTLNITDSATVKGNGTATELDDSDSQSNGIATDGSAIVVDTHTSYAGNMVINIADSATVESAHSYAIREIKSAEATSTNVVELSVSGNAKVTGVAGCIALKDASVGKITGGTFSANVSDYCTDGYVPVQNSDGTYGVTLEVPITGVTLSQPTASLYRNTTPNTVTLTATVAPADTTDNTAVTWTSSNPAVATVSNGVVTAVANGTATITATAGGHSATCTVTVSTYTAPSGGGDGGYTGGGTGGGGGSTTPPVVNIDDPDVPLAELPLPFEDVKDGDWYREAVAYVYSNGLMVGTSDTLFGVNTNTSRGMMATVIYRLEKEPNTTFKKIFSDVDNGMWYSNPITWANANKVAVGYDDGSFGPNDNVTREQLIAMLYRYASNKGYDVSKRADLSVFADTGKVSGYAEEAMSWAVAVGLIQGRGASKLAPTDLALRVEVATIFQRFASLYEAETLA